MLIFNSVIALSTILLVIIQLNYARSSYQETGQTFSITTIIITLFSLVINPIGWQVVFYLGLGYFIVWHFIYQNFRDNFKKELTKKLVTFINPEVNYSPYKCLSSKSIYKSGLFRRIDTTSGNDLVTGYIGATYFEFSDVLAQQGYRDEAALIYKGLFLKADFNKNFKHQTFIFPRESRHSFKLKLQDEKEYFIRYGSPVKLEDPDFEKVFSTYSSDQIEARYILSTALMQRILNYQKKAGKKLSFSFSNNSMYMAIHNQKDMFEPHLYRSLLKLETIQGYLEELSLVIDIVEDLNLNTRIWSKQTTGYA